VFLQSTFGHPRRIGATSSFSDSQWRSRERGCDRSIRIFLMDTVSIMSRLPCLCFPDIAPPGRFLGHPRVNPKVLCDAGKGHAQPAEMQDLVGYPHVNRDGIFVRQVHLDGDLGGGSNSFRSGAPLFFYAAVNPVSAGASTLLRASILKNASTTSGSNCWPAFSRVYARTFSRDQPGR